MNKFAQVANIEQQQDNFFLEDQASVYSPPEPTETTETILSTSAELAKKLAESEAKKDEAEARKMVYRQRTNPFLVDEAKEEEEGEEEEEGQQEDLHGDGGIVVRQVVI